MSSELAPGSAACPIAEAVLCALFNDYLQRVELRDPTTGDQLDTLSNRLRDEAPEDRSYAERSSRVMRCVTFATAESSRLAASLGIPIPALPAWTSEVLDTLIEACEFDRIETNLRDKPGAAPLRKEHVARAKEALSTACTLHQRACDRLQAPRESPEEVSLSRECGSLLADIFRKAEVPFARRLQYASWLLETNRSIQAYLASLNARPESE